LILASRRDQHPEDVRLRVMRLIDETSKMSSRQIADKVGIANGSAYYVLTALIKKGFVKLENFKNSQRKAQYASLLTPSGIREKSLLTHRFIGRKRQEFVALRAEIEFLEEEMALAKDVSSSQGSVK
jgi:EPS-associated MarR family transcriptional regulator